MEGKGQFSTPGVGGSRCNSGNSVAKFVGDNGGGLAELDHDVQSRRPKCGAEGGS